MEFGVDPNGRMYLQRDVRFNTHHGERTSDDPLEEPDFTWSMELVVHGMAGAVSTRFVGGNHRSRETVVLSMWGPGVTVDWQPEGTYVHAYRPWPTGTDGQVAEDCNLLALGRCFNQRLDDKNCTETRELLRKLANPGGLPAVFERLEQLYVREFCPPNEQRHYEGELRRLAATVEAYERAARPAAVIEVE